MTRNSKKIVSKKHQNLELELIINRDWYNKNLITKEMYLLAQDIILKLIEDEKLSVRRVAIQEEWW